MSESVRPSIPRPRTSAPPAARPASTLPPAPVSGPVLASSAPALAKTVAPPAMRERLATLDLDDADIVGIAVSPIKTGPPPAPRTPAPPAVAARPVSARPPAPPAVAARPVSVPPPAVAVAARPIAAPPGSAPPASNAPPPSAVSVPAPPSSAISLVNRVYRDAAAAGKTATPAYSFKPAPVPSFAAWSTPPEATRPRIDTEVEIERGWDDAAASVAPPAWEADAPAAVDPAPIVPPPPASVAPSPAPVSFAPPAPASVAPSPAPVSFAPPAPASVAPPPVSMLRPMTPAAPVAPQPQLLRLSINDPTDLIFDGMYGLTFARSTGEAAELCAETLAKALGARAVVIHTHDLASRELRAIGAHGDGDFDIIGSAEASDDDLVASAVICNQRSVTMRFDGELPRLAPKRLHAVGAPRTVVAAPAMSWGRCLAIVEVIDADERYAARVADSAAYVADHFAQFLCAHAA
ncbi:MAG: hypothetical protein KF894_13910 [Labilithrix sp.]|nr:hypothetical protein [Labilithrix sp.]